MSVLVKGMEMPDRCANCPFMDGEDSWCTAIPFKALDGAYKYGIKDKPNWCPLIPLPPHGRLIDADALIAAFKEMGLGENSLIERLFAEGVYLVIDQAQTVIEAEVEE